MQTKLNFKQSMMAALLAAGYAMVINSALYFLFHAMGIISDNIYVQPGQALTIVPVIISSALPSLSAGLVFFLFEKYSNKGFRNFIILSLILMLLSFANPFMIKGVTTGYALALNLMHIVVVSSLFYRISYSKKSSRETAFMTR